MRLIMSTHPLPGADGRRVIDVFTWERLLA